MSNTQARTRGFDRRLSGLSLAWVICFFATLVAVPARADTTVEVTRASLALDEGVYALDVRPRAQPARRCTPRDRGRAHAAAQLRDRDRSRAPLPARPGRGVAGAELRAELSRVEPALPGSQPQHRRAAGLRRGSTAALDRLADVRGLPLIDVVAARARPDLRVPRARRARHAHGARTPCSWLLFWTDDWSATSEWYAWTHRP